MGNGGGSRGGIQTWKIAIPNGQLTPLAIPNLLFNSATVTKVKINLVSTRVASTPDLIVSNEYTITCLWINGAWSLIQNNIVFNVGGWDEIVFSITALGQVQIITSNMDGTYDLIQSNLVYGLGVKG